MKSRQNEERFLLEECERAGAVIGPEYTSEEEFKSDLLHKRIIIPPLFDNLPITTRRRHFLLRSGFHTQIFFQMALALRFSHISQRIAMRLYKMLQKAGLIDQIDVLIGPPIGAMALIYALQHVINSDRVEAMYFNREPSGEFVLGRGFRLTPEKKVLIVDDVFTKGGSVKKAIDACHRAVSEYYPNEDSDILGVAVALDRSPEDGLPIEIRMPTLPFFPALTIPSVDYDPRDCPPCKNGDLLCKV